ncbi:uncharacterized protein LOC128128167 [Lactuca sativa]|uniref:uncharacterized protein LOC128128167 n=1 Tax=Lactuca sativa TaxID=4236 RepID=UPI0022AEDC4B|nr:uncharacterized protein LOC128128167 [Lactuca sativa]
MLKIPIATIKEIEKLCRSFLWANGEIVKGKDKVKWNDIYRPKLVKTNYIGNMNFWDILLKKSMSWTWKRFLEVRKIVRPHVVSCIGNGMNTSLWHDWCHPIGILCSIISRRDWVSNGFSDSSMVSEVLVNDIYIWSVEWVNKFPGLKDAPLFCIEPNQRDITDSHDHLFFKCNYAQLIWRHFCNKIGLNLFVDDWNELIMKLCNLFKRKSVENLVNKCVFASCVAHIWKERNSRLFSNRRKSYEGVIAFIESEIHLKLLGLRKKAKLVNDKVFKAWGISGMEKV